MNERVARLRQQSVDTRPYLSSERAELVTAFYRDAPRVSAPVLRAMTFRHLLENKVIGINPGELIVGERGPAIRATPTYPELCCHSLEDLEILDTRDRVAYAVPDEVKVAYRDVIIPFWRDRSMRDLLFSEMTEDWRAAYQAGVFTEFMEQRAPGHTVLDGKIYRKGFTDFKTEIAEARQALDYLNDPHGYRKQEQLKAMDICADAIIRFAQRHAEEALSLARLEPDPARKRELLRVAEVCFRVPANAPRDFHEALQAYWFVHLGVITELNTWDSFSPGRLDQHLYPFYREGLEQGTLTEEEARELLACFWIKFNNHPAPPKVGVTAAESGTYTDFANINTGGLRADGSDGVNELTYLILDVVDEMRLVQPSTNIQLSAKNPDRFLKRALAIVRKGWGQPSIFNADVVVQEMLRQGKSVEDARSGGTSGCVETGAFGKESYVLTGYFNLPKVLELALNDGVDPRTARRLGPATGQPSIFRSYSDIFEAFERQLTHFVNIKTRGNNVVERLYAEYMPTPVLSIVVDDCIGKGRDYHDGGARYNSTYIQGVGLGTATDSLTAIKHQVFDEGRLGLAELCEALRSDFQGHGRLQHVLREESPKYGNDDERADDVMLAVFRAFHRAVDGRPNTKGGTCRINLLPTTCHVYFGSMTGASPDGRNAWQPLSEGISPVQGADRQGPTAVLKSAGRMDHVLTGGTLLNLKLSPQVFEGEGGLEKVAHLVRSYFKLGGHHVQFNVVTSRMLREAQEHPERHRDLIVRVAGYSDYFSDLPVALQDEIISRTEHGAL